MSGLDDFSLIWVGREAFIQSRVMGWRGRSARALVRAAREGGWNLGVLGAAAAGGKAPSLSLSVSTAAAAAAASTYGDVVAVARTGDRAQSLSSAPALGALRIETRVLREQVVITNPTPSDVDLSGCELTDEFRRHTLVLPAGTVVKGGNGTVTVYTAPGNSKYLEPAVLARAQKMPFEESRVVLWRTRDGAPRRKEVLNNGGDLVLLHSSGGPGPATGRASPAPTERRAVWPPPRAPPPERSPPCASTRPYALSVGRLGGDPTGAADSALLLAGGPAARHGGRGHRAAALSPLAWTVPRGPNRALSTASAGGSRNRSAPSPLPS